MLSESQKKFAEEREKAPEKPKKEEENRLYLKKTEVFFKVTRPIKMIHV